MTLIVGVLAVVGVAATIRRRTVADKRTQAWQRITWCLERTLSERDAEAELGWRMYTAVTDSSLITRTEEEVLLAVVEDAALLALAPLPETEDTGGRDDQEDPR
ncbi:hypothetical protein ACTHQY_04885 [Rhodococcoides corynebacterioides]|uniref:hypothetical protein n=1 Tax=Rhodococcoides corynebacterioides TaxID=53972 RepID=UPI003F7DF2D9